MKTIFPLIFAIIAYANSSIIGTKLALKIAGYTITEGGFTDFPLCMAKTKLILSDIFKFSKKLI